MGTRDKDGRRREAGFALIVALMALLLLTFLGLTLATTTSTELQIANNYRWSQQAYYNAEAGLEMAKKLLREQTVWSIFVPQPRLTTGAMTSPPTWSGRGLCSPSGNCSADPNRDFENRECDTTAVSGPAAGAQGYGVVLDYVNWAQSYQNMNTIFGQTVPGTFTVWVRRPVVPQNDGTWLDYALQDRVIVTVEGTAPYAGNAAGNNVMFQNRAVRILEAAVRKIDPNDCENLSGQAGNGPSGAGYDPCSQVGPKGVPGASSEGTGGNDVSGLN
jgi:hypothetical protein